MTSTALVATSLLVAKLPAIIWIIVAMMGFGVQIKALTDVRADRKFLRTMGWNGRLRIMANAHVRNATIRTVVISGNLIIGLLSFTLPAADDRVPVSLPAKLVGAVLALILIGGEAALIAMTWFEQRDRRRLAATFRQPLPEEDDPPE